MQHHTLMLLMDVHDWEGKPTGRVVPVILHICEKNDPASQVDADGPFLLFGIEIESVGALLWEECESLYRRAEATFRQLVERQQVKQYLNAERWR